MTSGEFQVLYEYYKETLCLDAAGNQKMPMPLSEVESIRDDLQKKGWIKEEKITPAGYDALEPYKVDNAIIMAAGFGLRSLPLSRYVPKGLYKIREEILIERQIEQILSAGIKEIVVVVGYLKEQFMYLKDKYGVIIVENDDYYRYNNVSSVYAARDYLKNSYICCSDNYFMENVFNAYVYDSYYSCKFSEGYADEYCVMETEGDYITKIEKGGSNAWYTIGEAYFTRGFSEVFLKYLSVEYENNEIKKMLWDDFHMRHIDELKLRLYKYTDDIVQEFDSIEDIIRFDPEFIKYRDEILEREKAKPESMPNPLAKYEDIERYNSATTDEHEGRLHLNENTFGPSRKCLDALKEITIRDLYEYDMASEDFLITELSKAFSMPADDIYIHNGSAEIIKSVFSIALERGDSILTSNPGWSYYASIAKEKFCEVHYYSVSRDDYRYYFDVKDILEKACKYKPRIIVLNSPHNPTGCRLDGNAVEEIIKQNKDSLILLDEAYWGFSEEDIDIRRLVESYTNVIVSRTFSKYYGLANARIGFGFCNSKVKHVFGLDLPLFRESTISRRLSVEALRDKAYYENMNKELNEVKTWFIDSLNRIPRVHAFVSHSNFVAVQADDMDLKLLQKELREKGILIRLFFDEDDCLARIAISDRMTMEKTLEFIKEIAAIAGGKHA